MADAFATAIRHALGAASDEALAESGARQDAFRGIGQGYALELDDLARERATGAVDTQDATGGKLIQNVNIVGFEQEIVARRRVLGRCTLKTGLSGNAYLAMQNRAPTVSASGTEPASDEAADATESAITFSRSEIAPTLFRATVVLNRRLLTQADGSVGLMGRVRKALVDAVLLKVEDSVLKGGGGMTGIINETGIKSETNVKATLTAAQYRTGLLSLIEDFEDEHLMFDENNFAFVMSPANMRRWVEFAQADGDRARWGDIYGRPVIRTQAFGNAERIVVGDWSRMHVGFYKNVGVVVDTATYVKSGKVAIRVFLEAGYAVALAATFGLYSLT